MIDLLQVVSVMLVALTAASAMAHAMELPGKMRLDKDVYFAVQKRKEQRPPDWTELRNRWEYSHAVRAALSSVSLLALVISLVVQQ
jgi:hypothetical protein